MTDTEGKTACAPSENPASTHHVHIVRIARDGRPSRVARAWARDVLVREAGCADCVDDVLWTLGELVCNSFTHTQTDEVRVTLGHWADYVIVWVADDGRTTISEWWPLRATPDLDGESGRGLWGVRELAGGMIDVRPTIASPGTVVMVTLPHAPAA